MLEYHFNSFVFCLRKFLTVWFFCLTDKSYTNPKLSLINVPALNYLLRSQIFVNDDRQLRAVHLILDFEPISRSFLEVGNSIRADDHHLAHIDVSRVGFSGRFPCSIQSSSRRSSYSTRNTFRRPTITTSTPRGSYYWGRSHFLFFSWTRNWQIQVWRRSHPYIGGWRRGR